MGTAVGAHLENPKPQQSERVVPRAYAAWLLGIFLLTSFWLWAAFVRGRVHSRASQLLLLLVCAALLAGFGWLVSGALRRRFSLSSREGAKILAYSSSAFLLLLVFFPEYLMGRPVLVRSFLLLGFSLLLFAFYLALSLRGAASSIKRPQPNVAPAIALVIFCAAYFVLTSWITLAKLHAFGYVGQDIAYFTQCLYSNMYHDLLYGKPVTSDLAGHNQLVLFLFLPFFMLHKAASTLLIVRNFAIVLCAWPVYLIGRRFLSPWLAAIAAIAFLLLPAVLYQNFYDFAPLSLAGLPLLFA